MRGVINLRKGCLRLRFDQFFSYSDMKSSSGLVRDPESKSDHESTIHVRKILEFIPKLSSTLRKGQCGRVGIIGGSKEYTGAPYFAAISSLKLGADLVYVFCCRDAAPAIKSYSPELIVDPILDSVDAVEKIRPWLGKLHALVIGPGLGRDPGVLKNVGDIITYCKENMNSSIALIIDADGLFLIGENIDLIKNYQGPLILTPNIYEFKVLADKMSEINPFKVAAALNAVIVQKGETDLILNGIFNRENKLPQEMVKLTCETPGSARRCGGQGDILSGCVATLIAWLEIHLRNNSFHFNKVQPSDAKKLDLFLNTFMKYSFASYGGCLITRTCSQLAFKEHGRGMTASDMINYIPKAFQEHFGY